MDECGEFFSADQISSDILQSIQEDDIPYVLEKLKSDWPDSMSVHAFITTRYEWMKKGSPEKFYVLCPHGSWKNGTIVAVATEDVQVVIYTLEEGCHELKNALIKTKLLNWNKRILQFPYVHEKHLDALKQVFQYRNIDMSKVLINTDTFFIIPEEKVKTMETPCPSGMFIAHLKPHHAQIVYDDWLYKKYFPFCFVEKVVTYNKCLGMFNESDGKLICWAAETDYGIGLLNTIPAYRRKGYASIVLQHLIKDLYKEGRCTGTHVQVDNAPSSNTFKRLGYEPICFVSWVFVM